MFIKKIIIGLVLVSLSCVVLAEDDAYTNSFKPGSEPDGFRNIKWGTPIFNLEKENFQLVSSSGNEKIYVKENENYVLDKLRVKKIEYCFWDDMFYKVNIYTDGSGRSRAALHVLRNFGRGNKFKGCYRYKGSETGLMLCEPPDQGPSVLTFYSLFYFSRRN